MNQTEQMQYMTQIQIDRPGTAEAMREWEKHPDSGQQLAFFADHPIRDIYKLSHCRYSKTSVPLKPHLHENCFEICYHCSGRQQYTVGGKDYITGGGDIFITFPNEVHSTGTAPETKSDFFYLVFHCMPDTENFMGLDSADSDLIRNTLWGCRKRVFRGDPKMSDLCESILKIYFEKEPLSKSRCIALFTQFFYLLCMCIHNSSESTKSDMPEDIESIVTYIDEHPYEIFSVEKLAKQVYLSNAQLQRKFKRYVGFSPYDYILRQKVRSAKEMMQYTCMNFTEISEELGFSSGQHFSFVFKNYEGISPSEYRKLFFK